MTFAFQDGSTEVVGVPGLGLDRPRHLLLHPDQQDHAPFNQVRNQTLVSLLS